MEETSKSTTTFTHSEKVDPRYYSKNIAMCHVNIRSLLCQNGVIPRLTLLHNFATKENQFDIVALSETHLDNTINSNELDMEGYTLFRKDRNRSGGGGVALYVKNELASYQDTSVNLEGIESLFVKISSNNFNFVCGVCYRPPNQSALERDFFVDNLNTQLDRLCTNNVTSIYLLGDFNDKCVAWHSDHADSELKLNLKLLFDEFNLVQLIDVPTRGKNILDLIITDTPSSIVRCGTLDSFDTLDHRPVFAVISMKFNKLHSYKRRVRNYSDENLVKLNNNLKLVPWSALLLNESTADDMIDTFYSIIYSELDICITVKEVTIRPKDKPGMNSEVRKLLKTSNRLNRISKRTNALEDIIEHQVARRTAKRAWKQARKQYHARLAENICASSRDNSSSKQWKILHSFYDLNKKSYIGTLCDGKRSFVTDKEKAECLNDFFAEQSQINVADEPELPQQINYRTASRLSNITVSDITVYNILKELDTSKATGPDGIGNLLLKSCAESLCLPVAIITEHSIINGVFPSKWKSANIVPIFKKKGSQQSSSNYRPVSLLCSLSKVVERLVYDQLYFYCITNNLLSEKNSGFKKGDGAINQLLQMTDSIYSSLNAGKEVAMVFLDISKAFDRVWHRGLQYKLKCLGIDDLLYSWMCNYLSNRQQKVVLNGVESSVKYTNAGVPQGSILGPLLFLIFINDFEFNVKSDVFLFADDANLSKPYVNPHDAAQCINSDLNALEKWAADWMINFNASKTTFINFSLKKKKTNLLLSFKGIQLEQVDEHKHLGVIFTSDLRWTRHIDERVSKAGQQLGLLRRRGKFLSRAQKETIYCSMIRPIIEYGSMLYNNCSLHDSNRIEGVQRKAALICTGAIKRTESKKLMTELNWDSLSQRRAFAKLCILYKIIKGMSPPYLGQRYIVTSSTRVSRLTDASHRLFQPLCRLSCYQSSFFPSTIKLWNALPSDVAGCSSVMLFKISLRSNLMMSQSNCQSRKGSYNLLSTGRLGKTLTQIRLGLSPLNHHLFVYNIGDNPFCPSCGSDCDYETTLHYFCICKNYDVERLILKNSVSRLLFNLSLTCRVEFDIENHFAYTTLLLNGFSCLPVSDIIANNENSIEGLEAMFNASLHCGVIRYMYNTARFAINCT